MRQRRSDKTIPTPWHAPVALADIVEAGQHFDLVADGDVRTAVSRLAGLRDLPRLEANFDVTRHGAEGLHVVGRVSATVGQNCVVTLEPLTNDVEEEVDLLFMPQQPAHAKLNPLEDSEERTRKAPSEANWGGPEPLIDGVVDLGAVATEFLILGLDPYPRKPGAVFELPQDFNTREGPFAVLAELTKGRNGH